MASVRSDCRSPVISSAIRCGAGARGRASISTRTPPARRRVGAVSTIGLSAAGVQRVTAHSGCLHTIRDGAGAPGRCLGASARAGAAPKLALPSVRRRIVGHAAHCVYPVASALPTLIGVEAIAFERDPERPGLATITLSRPDKLNGINLRMHEELQQVCRALQDDVETRVVILTGAGRAFS